MIKKYNTPEEKAEGHRLAQVKYKESFKKEIYNAKERSWEANRRHYFETNIFVSPDTAKTLYSALKLTQYESVEDLIIEMMKFWIDNRKTKK